MDRAAEIWLLARRWRAALAARRTAGSSPTPTIPLVAWAAGQARQVTWVAAGQRWHEDSWCCPNCGSHLQRDGDDWHCGECPNRRPPVSWVLAGDEVIDPDRPVAARWTWCCPAGPTGPTPWSRSRWRTSSASASRRRWARSGRCARWPAGTPSSSAAAATLRLLLAKNPAGWLEALDVLAPPPAPVLLAVNAQVPDGRDTSWLWDVDYRRLRGRPVFVAGERKIDLAVRLEADEVAFRLVGRRRRGRGRGAQPGHGSHRELHGVPADPRGDRAHGL